jgi:hypothetical protein
MIREGNFVFSLLKWEMRATDGGRREVQYQLDKEGE